LTPNGWTSKRVVWGTTGSVEQAGDRFFAELDPELAADATEPEPPEPAEIQAEPLLEPPGPDPEPQDAEQRVGERAAKLNAMSMDMGPGYAKAAAPRTPIRDGRAAT
jgi:hypothetical protein